MQRVDILLTELGLATSRTHAQRLLKNGRVAIRVGDQWSTLTKPGVKLAVDTEFQVTPDEADRFVSRGALKLLGALERSALDVSGMIALDVGQSTGGFTDCLLQAGASVVVGVEVGHDQLAPRLRADNRVVCYEGINGRDLPAEILLPHTGGCGFDVAVMDVSFISQTKILPSLIPLLRPGGWLITLVKPQFEVGKAGIGSGGIVRDNSLYAGVEKDVKQCVTSLGMQLCDYFESPIKGGDGNREFLLIAKQPGNPSSG